jgi:hypothetical protein
MRRNVTGVFTDGCHKLRFQTLLVAVCPQWAAVQNPDTFGFFNTS